MLIDYFIIAVRNLRRRGVRTLLTLIGIFIGITAIVSLISLGQGFEKAITEEFEMMGSDKLFITAGKGERMSSMMLSSSKPLTDEDLRVVRSLKGIKEAGGLAYGIVPVRFKGKMKYTYLSGYPTDSSRVVVESMRNMKIAEGRDLRKNDKYKVVVGKEIYNGNLFGTKVKIGDRLDIMGKTFKVVGFFAPFGNSQDDSSVAAPLETVRKLLNKNKTLNFIIAQVIEGGDVNAVKLDVEKALRRYRNVKKGDEDFNVKTTKELLNSFQIILSVVQIVFLGIAGISLVVGGIGIMNSMFTSVLERTNEIGVMKAIGAKNSDIMWIFLIESGLVGAVGGIIGISLGVLLSKAIEAGASMSMGVTYMKAYFPPSLILGTLAFSFAVGTLFGIIPAIRASRMNPVNALRYE